MIIEARILLKILVLFTVLHLPLTAQSAIINLNGNLSAANQNGITVTITVQLR
jgi:hypothetical protein